MVEYAESSVERVVAWPNEIQRHFKVDCRQWKCAAWPNVIEAYFKRECSQYRWTVWPEEIQKQFRRQKKMPTMQVGSVASSVGIIKAKTVNAVGSISRQ